MHYPLTYEERYFEMNGRTLNHVCWEAKHQIQMAQELVKTADSETEVVALDQATTARSRPLFTCNHCGKLGHMHCKCSNWLILLHYPNNMTSRGLF